jgi:hypothetical protein
MTVTEIAMYKSRTSSQTTEVTDCESGSCIVPNEETIAAMQEALSGDLPRFASVSELMADLNAIA